AEPAGSAEATGRRAAPGEARDRPRRFHECDAAAELSMPADDVLRERLGPDGFSTSDFRDNHRIVVPAEKLYAALEALKVRGGFDYLVDITAVDYLHYPDAADRFGVIYILTNTAT